MSEEASGNPGAWHVGPLKAVGAGTLMLRCDPNSLRNSAIGYRAGGRSRVEFLLRIYHGQVDKIVNRTCISHGIGRSDKGIERNGNILLYYLMFQMPTCGPQNVT